MYYKIVVALLAKMLDRSPGDIEADKGRYAAFHWDTCFGPEHQVDWNKGVVGNPHPAGSLLYGRGDFDLKRSVVGSEHLMASRHTDTSLRNLMIAQGDTIVGSQATALIKQGRVQASDCEDGYLFGCMRGGESLVEAGAALFMLGGPRPLLSTDQSEHAKVHADWMPYLRDLTDDTNLRSHLGLFFQDPEAALCSGGSCLHTDPNRESMLAQALYAAVDGIAIMLSFWMGDGQGDTLLAKLPDDWQCSTPEFLGHTLIRKAPSSSLTAEERDLSQLKSDPLGVLSKSISAHKFIAQAVAAQRQGIPLSNFLKPFKAQRQLVALSNLAGELCTKEHSKAALLLLLEILRLADDEDKLVVTRNLGIAYAMLKHFDEALESCKDAISFFAEFGSFTIPQELLLTNASYYAYKAGKISDAKSYANRVLAIDPYAPKANAYLGAILMEQGDLSGSLEALELCMKQGIDPELGPELTAQDSYRELALKYKIPVELGEDET